MSASTRRIIVAIATAWLALSACLPTMGLGLWYSAIDRPQPAATQAAIGSAMTKVGGGMLWPMLNHKDRFFPLAAPSELPDGIGLFLATVITVVIPLVLNSLLWAAVITGAILLFHRMRQRAQGHGLGWRSD